jgi:hypothetical protein
MHVKEEGVTHEKAKSKQMVHHKSAHQAMNNGCGFQGKRFWFSRKMLGMFADTCSKAPLPWHKCIRKEVLTVCKL